jgi:ParB family chromosome partitioning protein
MEVIDMTQKKVLGRGLGALIEDPGEPIPSGGPLEVRIEAIEANPLQPRAFMREKELKGLTDSIRDMGVLEPLLVRRKEHGFELIAGERRLRAAQAAGLTTVPVIVREATRTEMLELALIENLHREDLNPMDEAEGYQRLADEFERTNEQIARLAGKDRSTVANLVRLLSLPSEVQGDVRVGRMSAGHGRALLALGDPDMILTAREQVLTRGLSVRETESLVKRAMGQGRKKKPPAEHEAYYQSLSDTLTRTIGSKSHILPSTNKKGKIVIEYKSIKELETLLLGWGVTNRLGI